MFSSVLSWSLLAMVPMVTANIERVTTRLVPVVETLPDATLTPSAAPFLVDGQKSIPLRLTTVTYIDAENSTILAPVTTRSTEVDEIVQKSVAVLTVPVATETASRQRGAGHSPTSEHKKGALHVPAAEQLAGNNQPSSSAKPNVVVVQPKESTQEVITVTKSSNPQIVVIKPEEATSVVISYVTDTKVLTSTHWVTLTAQSAATVQGSAKVTVTKLHYSRTTITRVHLSTSYYYPPQQATVTVTETASNPYLYGVGASHTPAPYYNHDAADGDPGGIQWAQGVHTNPKDRSAEFTKVKPSVWPMWGANGQLMDIKAPWLHSKKTTATTSGVVYGRAQATTTSTSLSTVEVTSVVDVTSTIDPRCTAIVTSTVQSIVEVNPTPSLDVPVQEKHHDLKLKHKIRDLDALKGKRSYVPGKWTTLSGIRSPPFPTYGPPITSLDAWPKPQMTTITGTRKPAFIAPALAHEEEEDQDTVKTVFVHGFKHTTYVTKPSVITITHTYTHLTTSTVVVPDDDDAEETPVSALKAEEEPISAAEETQETSEHEIEARDFPANVKVPRKYYDPAKYTLITGTRKSPFPTFGPPITWDENWPKVSMATLSGTRKPPFPTFGLPLTWGENWLKVSVITLSGTRKPSASAEKKHDVVTTTVSPVTTTTLYSHTVTVTSTHLITSYKYVPTSSASAPTDTSRTMKHGIRMRDEEEEHDAIPTATATALPKHEHAAPSPNADHEEPSNVKHSSNAINTEYNNLLNAKLTALIFYMKHNFEAKLAEHKITTADLDIALQNLQNVENENNLRETIEAYLINFETLAAQGAQGAQKAQWDFIAEFVKFLCLFVPFCPPPETHP